MAFGDRPADPVRAHPDDPPEARWAAAVALGGRGRYAAARALLDRLRLDPATPPALRAHAVVTLAAHLRQQGGHRLARRWDGLGLALATAAVAHRPEGPRSGDPHLGDRHLGDAHPDDPHLGDPHLGDPAPGDPHLGDPHPSGPHPGGVGADAAAARVDALLGLAADALGLGDLARSARLVAAAEPAARAHPSWRPLVRWRWVRAELALARDDPTLAADTARAAAVTSHAVGAIRHEVKSELIAVVARRVVEGGTEEVRRRLEGLTERTIVARLGSLEWPTRAVLGELLNGADAAEAGPNEVRLAESRAAIRRWTDPLGRSVIDRSPWVSDVLGS